MKTCRRFAFYNNMVSLRNAHATERKNPPFWIHHFRDQWAPDEFDTCCTNTNRDSYMACSVSIQQRLEITWVPVKNATFCLAKENSWSHCWHWAASLSSAHFFSWKKGARNTPSLLYRTTKGDLSKRQAFELTTAVKISYQLETDNKPRAPDIWQTFNNLWLIRKLAPLFLTNLMPN